MGVVQLAGMRRWLVVSTLASAGCGTLLPPHFVETDAGSSSSSGVGTGSSGSPMTTSGGLDGTTAVASGSSGTTGSTGVATSSTDDGSGSTGTPSGLVDDDLLVRYFIDEQSRGIGPAIEDSGPRPLAPLSILYSESEDQPLFVEYGSNRGLEWGFGRTEGSVLAPVAGKVLDGLAGSMMATFELVIELGAVGVPGQPGMVHRLVDIGDAILIGTADESDVVCNINMQADTIRWTLDGEDLQTRRVVHLVFDVSPMHRGAPVQLFLDGQFQAPTEGTQPPDGVGLVLQNGDELILGNNEFDNRSMEGVLYYAAIYDGVLTDEEIESNVALLQLDDDTQP